MGIFVSKKAAEPPQENKPADSSEVSTEDIQYCEDGLNKLQADPDCHSLLKKHFSKDVLEELKCKRTERFHSNLRSVIQSGVENLDSGIGVYAPDAEAYAVFALLFDPIIEEYHGGFGKDQVHPPSDFGDPSAFGDLDPEKKCGKINVFFCN